MTIDEELLALAGTLTTAAEPALLEKAEPELQKVIDAATQVGKSFSGSWLGYHSRIYYAELKPTPPGAHFSQEWGMDNAFGMGTSGDWREYDGDNIKAYIYEQAGDVDLAPLRQAARAVEVTFNRSKADIESILSGELSSGPDTFLEKLKEDLTKMRSFNAQQVAQDWSPKGQVMTRDTLALGQGIHIPPHIAVLADARSLSLPFAICSAAAEIATRAASHIGRKTRRRRSDARIGTNVFIGHGRSLLWRELKDFVQDRLKLPWDEFNRVPVAGVTNIARLSEMLDAAAIALLVMTAEDETAEGLMRARENVIHEVGLFQGRLGFSRAIVLLEEGCQEFSNIQGLGQIRFSQGNIRAAFEQVRHVMEREGLIAE